VLRDRGAADRQIARELADRHRAVEQPAEDGASRAVAQRIELNLMVSIH
jgi:hypothetical protein